MVCAASTLGPINHSIIEAFSAGLAEEYITVTDAQLQVIYFDFLTISTYRTNLQILQLSKIGGTSVRECTGNNGHGSPTATFPDHQTHAAKCTFTSIDTKHRNPSSGQ